MKHWRVTGDDKSTGRKRTILLHADDENGARQSSFGRGVVPKLVEDVEEVPTIPYAQPTPQFQNAPRCPVCGNQSPPVLVQRGSSAVCVLLLLLAIVPGILYAALAFGKHWACPNCGTRFGEC